MKDSARVAGEIGEDDSFQTGEVKLAGWSIGHESMMIVGFPDGLR
jgi:hypothetical protein